jgi:hypothetical protein
MPSYIGRPDDLRNSGPLVQVQLSVPQVATSESEIVIPPMNITALVDTGSDGTIIQEGIATALKLSQVGTTKLGTPTKLSLECPKQNNWAFLSQARLSPAPPHIQNQPKKD